MKQLKKTEMKTKVWVLTTLAFLIVAIGYASKIPKMNIISADAQRVLITYNAPFSSPLEISIIDDDGDIVYFKRTKSPHSEYRKVFDCTKSGNGKYNVCINYGNQSINRQFSIENDEIKTETSERLYEPYFSIKNGKLNVSFFNVSMKNVDMKIYKNGTYISEVSFGKQMVIQKCVNMSDLRNGEYELVLKDFFKEHRYFVQL